MNSDWKEAEKHYQIERKQMHTYTLNKLGYLDSRKEDIESLIEQLELSLEIAEDINLYDYDEETYDLIDNALGSANVMIDIINEEIKECEEILND